MNSLNKKDLQITFSVGQSASEVFRSVSNIAEWWTENVKGDAFKLNDEFTVQFGDVHFSKQQLVEVVPDKKVVWLVTESQLSWLRDKQEWNGTRIVFEIDEQEGGTQLQFTHIGLTPGVECYNGCSGAWGQYVGESLFNLITTGKGQPEKKQKMTAPDFTTTLLVEQTPEQVFNAINKVNGWWLEEIEGSTNKLNDEFKYHYEDVHRCKIKIIEMVPNQKVVWLVEDNYFKFTKDNSEWKGTKVMFEIGKKDNKTQLRFTHLGLVPEYECYEVCKQGWTNYIQNSLHNLITTGKGLPNGKGKPQTEAEKKLGSGQ